MPATNYFALQTLLQNKSDGKRDVIKYVLTHDGQKIVDQSFLPIEARERCEGIDVVWGKEPCEDTGKLYIRASTIYEILKKF